MEIYLHNTLTNNTEHFRPLEKGLVKMYNCGPTVYNKVHIGNLRSYIFADTLRRIFEYNDLKVDQVINITDVGHLTDDGDDGEDKMEKGAKEQKKTAAEIADEYTNYFLESLKKINIDTENIKFPKATDHIKEQIEMITKLEEKGYVYKTSDGIYFDTSKFKSYGKLGGIVLKGLQEGARVESNEEKRNYTDFALWKFSDPKEKRQQEWESPWGVGFPGWHIECSSMSEKYLGKEFDIHTGGIDHIPTHHNNEIAQSECVNDTIQAKFWMHHNHILINGEKMSKSLGNVTYIEDLEEKDISPSIYRYWMLTADYKTLINFTDEAVSAAGNAFKKLIESLSENREIGKINKEYKEKFQEAVNTDIDTAKGIAILWELMKDSDISDKDKLATVLDFDKVLGLNIQSILNQSMEIPESIEELAKEREEARSSKDFNKSDEIRDKIEELGFEIKDTPEGYRIVKK